MKKQRHKYEYKVSPDSAAAKIARFVGGDKCVLELGPGPGAITQILKGASCRVTALEVDPEAIGIVGEFCEKVLSCDLNAPNWPDVLPAGSKFDAIIAGDVLEHLYDPWSVLGKLHELLEPDGYLVISLPHIAHSAIVASLLVEDFDYQPWGLLDRTHIRFFGIRNIQKLFNDAGFKIIEAEFIVRAPEHTEFARHWRSLPAETRQALQTNRLGNVYQVVIKAAPYSVPGGSLELVDLPVPAPGDASYSIGARGNPVMGLVLSFFSLKAREKITRLIERIGIRL